MYDYSRECADTRINTHSITYKRTRAYTITHTVNAHSYTILRLYNACNFLFFCRIRRAFIFRLQRAKQKRSLRLRWAFFLFSNKAHMTRLSFTQNNTISLMHMGYINNIIVVCFMDVSYSRIITYSSCLVV